MRVFCVRVCVCAAVHPTTIPQCCVKEQRRARGKVVFFSCLRPKVLAVRAYKTKCWVSLGIVRVPHETFGAADARHALCVLCECVRALGLQRACDARGVEL